MARITFNSTARNAIDFAAKPVLKTGVKLWDGQIALWFRPGTRAAKGDGAFTVKISDNGGKVEAGVTIAHERIVDLNVKLEKGQHYIVNVGGGAYILRHAKHGEKGRIVGVATVK